MASQLPLFGWRDAFACYITSSNNRRLNDRVLAHPVHYFGAQKESCCVVSSGPTSSACVRGRIQLHPPAATTGGGISGSQSRDQRRGRAIFSRQNCGVTLFASSSPPPANSRGAPPRCFASPLLSSPLLRSPVTCYYALLPQRRPPLTAPCGRPLRRPQRPSAPAAGTREPGQARARSPSAARRRG